MELKSWERWKTNKAFDYMNHRETFLKIMETETDVHDNILDIYKSKWKDADAASYQMHEIGDEENMLKMLKSKMMLEKVIVSYEKKLIETERKKKYGTGGYGSYTQYRY